MFDKERSGIDRHSGADRRRVVIDYWLSEGVERRRSEGEGRNSSEGQNGLE